MVQSTEEQVLMTAQGPAGYPLTAECPRADMNVAKAILEQLAFVHQRIGWHVDIKSRVITITCDKAPNYGFVTTIDKLGKGYVNGQGLRPSIKSIGHELLERIGAGVHR